MTQWKFRALQTSRPADAQDSSHKVFVRGLLRVRDRMMCDGNLTAAARLVGWYIFWRVNKNSRDAWPSHETIASDLQISVKTAKRATLSLRRANYITAELNGRYNRYKPVVPDPHSEVPADSSLEPTHSGAAGTIYPAAGSLCPASGTNHPDNPDQNDPLSPYDRSPSRESPPTTPSARGAHEWTSDELVVVPIWARLGAMLERVLGPLVFKSWFTNVRVVEVSQTAIALSAPSQFVAREINRRYGGHLMRCVRVELPAIQSIQIEAGKVRLDIRGE